MNTDTTTATPRSQIDLLHHRIGALYAITSAPWSVLPCPDCRAAAGVSCRCRGRKVQMRNVNDIHWAASEWADPGDRVREYERQMSDTKIEGLIDVLDATEPAEIPIGLDVAIELERNPPKPDRFGRPAGSDLPLIAVQDKGHFWAWQRDGSYRHADTGPMSLWTTCRDSWGLPDLFRDVLYRKTKQGERAATTAEIVEAHGQKIDAIEIDHTLIAPTLRGAVLALPPKRGPLPSPVFHEDVESWLSHLLGDDGTDWLACSGVEKLGAFLPALALVGPAGCGKTVLAHAVAATHGLDGATDAVALLGTFNDGADTSSVFVFDEKTQRDARGVPQTREIRSKITEASRRINPKGRTPFKVRGAVRLVFSANSDAAIFPDVGALTEHDALAVGERFLYRRITAQDAASAKAIVDRIGCSLEDRLRILAQHIRWLQLHHDVPRPAEGSRFLVETDAHDLVAVLRKASQGVEEILGALPGHVRFKDGHWYASPAKLADLIKHPRLRAKEIGIALREHLALRDERGEPVSSYLRGLWHGEQVRVIELDRARVQALLPDAEYEAMAARDAKEAQEAARAAPPPPPLPAPTN